LSERRATSVSGYLEGQGTSGARLTIKGYGETIPKYENNTPEGRTENRRVEFLITANEKMKAEAAKTAGQ
jgi:outer membrane protein OmpA-like peptidoglycan-associated protein